MTNVAYNESAFLPCSDYSASEVQATPLYFGYEKLISVGNILRLANRMSKAYSADVADVVVPLRSSIQQEDPFFAFDTMPAYSAAHQLFMVKIGAVIPKKNPSQKSVHALVVAFSATTGCPIAIFDGDAVTNLKCAAVTAMITDLCSVEDAKALGLIGSGVQALGQLSAITAVRPLVRVNIYSRNEERVFSFIQKFQPYFPEITFKICHSADEACCDVDIVSTATTSTAPLMAPESLQRKGLHINCLGNHIPESREIPIEVLRNNSILIVEDLQTAIEEAGEVHKKAISLDKINTLDRNTLKRERTIFSSTGHALLDLLTTDYLIEKLSLKRL